MKLGGEGELWLPALVRGDRQGCCIELALSQPAWESGHAPCAGLQRLQLAPDTVLQAPGPPAPGPAPLRTALHTGAPCRPTTTLAMLPIAP